MIAFAWAWACIAGAQPLPDDGAATDAAEQADADAPDDTGAAAEPAAPVAPAPPPHEPVAKPSFLASNTLDIDGADGDVFATARTIRVSAPLADNAYLMGQNVRINEEIHGDAMLMGQSVVVAAPVWGDVYTAGEEIRIAAPVHGNVYAAGNRVAFTSDVFGDVEVSAREVELSSHLHQAASLRYATIKMGEGAKVGGDLRYVAPRRNDRFDAIAEGDARFTLGDFDVDVDPSDPMGILSDVFWGLLGIVGNYLSLLAVGGVLLAVAGPFLRGPSKSAAEQPVMSAALGAVAVVVTPVVGLLAMVTWVTLPLGLITLALWGVGIYIARLYTASALGHVINRRFFPAFGKSDFAALATGLVPLVILAAIPQLVGFLITALTVCVGFGALWLHWRDEARDRRVSRKRG